MKGINHLWNEALMLTWIHNDICKLKHARGLFYSYNLNIETYP